VKTVKASNMSMEERVILEQKQKMCEDFKNISEQYVKDHELMAWYRGVWVVLVAVSAEYGFAKTRLGNILLRVGKMIPGLVEYKQADVLDEILIRDLEAVGMNIRNTCPEYFEAKERLDKYGKYIDKQKALAEAKAKEREFLSKVNTNLFVKGIGRYV
jgi:hypothetical protein